MSILHPTNINELIENSLIELGHPVIKIDVADIQSKKAAMSAIDLFTEYHYDGTETVFICQELTEEDLKLNFITTPKIVHSVIRVLGVGHAPNHLSGHGCGCYNGSYGDFGSVSPMLSPISSDMLRGKGLVSMYLASAHRSYFKNILHPNIATTWNKTSKRIRFEGHISQATSGCQKNVVIYEARIVNENLEFDCGTTKGNGSCFYENPWLQQMTAAQIKKTWASNLKKFQNINVVNGFDFNGENLYQEAKEEIEKLKEELFTMHSFPATMIVG